MNGGKGRRNYRNMGARDREKQITGKYRYFRIFIQNALLLEISVINNSNMSKRRE
jgi:hypothetical protein